MSLDLMDDQPLDMPERDHAEARTYVTLTLGEQAFALDVRHVREILDLQPMSELPHAPADVVGLIDLRGQTISVANLAMRLGLRRSLSEGEGRILIVEAGPDRAPTGLLVDRVDNVLEIDADSLEPPPAAQSGWRSHAVAAVTREGGRLTLVLSADHVLGAGEDPAF